VVPSFEVDEVGYGARSVREFIFSEQCSANKILSRNLSCLVTNGFSSGKGEVYFSVTLSSSREDRAYVEPSIDVNNGLSSEIIE